MDAKFDFDTSAREPPWMMEEDAPVARPHRAARSVPVPEQASIQILMDMGFEQEIVLEALIRTEGDLDNALALLLD